MTEGRRDENRGLIERLDAGPVICAEGYLFELERRGYVKAGPFVPEVVLEAPEAVAALHREFVAAGREDDLERLNRAALAIAAGVAAESGTLLAGNVSNTHLSETDDAATDAA